MIVKMRKDFILNFDKVYFIQILKFVNFLEHQNKVSWCIIENSHSFEWNKDPVTERILIDITDNIFAVYSLALLPAELLNWICRTTLLMPSFFFPLKTNL